MVVKEVLYGILSIMKTPGSESAVFEWLNGDQRH